MWAEIIAIGDEILIGQITDTNSTFIAKALTTIGISVRQITSIQDTRTNIIDALATAKKSVDIVIITGGLGPTKDDVTRQSLCDFFDDTLVFNEEVLSHIKGLFQQYAKKPMLDANRSQAEVPTKATLLKNDFGTAPGMWFEEGDTVFVSLPGVPYEMKNLINKQVLPKLEAHFCLPYISNKTVLTYGMGESAIAQKIESFEDALPQHFKLAYLPSPGKVRVRLSTKGVDKDQVQKEMRQKLDQLLHLLEGIAVGIEEDGQLEQIIAKLLLEKGATLSLAESCTGGFITSLFTQHSGASGYFRGGAVTYATDTKVSLLNVNQEIIDQQSVVSVAVAEAMARGAQKQFSSHYAIATTGNAGPEKGDSQVEVGTVCIAIATPSGVFSGQFIMGNSRERVIRKTANKALEMLWKQILKN